MNVGIVGLGLIGGSIARAIKHDTEDTVLGTDIKSDVVFKAKLLDAIDKELTDETIGICDYIIVALYPAAAVEYVKNNYRKFKPGVIVMDTCGVKQFVCNGLGDFAKEHGFTFIGAHPMAGAARVGFDNSNQKMFNNASIIITPPKDAKIELLDQIKKFWGAIGFTNMEITTPENHDRVIAYTSQLCHIASNAFVKSPTAIDHKGFSAGSYKDLTRVAWLNENMWTELFLENKDYLLEETDRLISSLQEYAKAIREEDAQTLCRLLKEGREQKELADKNDMK